MSYQGFIIRIDTNQVGKANAHLPFFTEYYLRCHARKLRKAYKDLQDEIIVEQVYSVDAVKLEYVFKQTSFLSKVIDPK